MKKVEKVIYYCDIDKCENEAQNIERQMQVIFTTEQTEGRSVQPYLCLVKIDVCKSCIEKIIKSGEYIVAFGAQGFNTYRI